MREIHYSLGITSQQTRLRDDLRGLIEGEVRCDDVALQLYSSDASVYEAMPSAVVWPKSTDDVVACVTLAADRNIPIHARGAGTGTTGGCLGSGIVLDFTRSMRRTLQSDECSAVIQPGAVRLRTNAQLQINRNSFFAPNPGFSPATTIGSILASDGSGRNWLKYGSPRNHLLELQVVLANGDVLQLKTEFLETVRDTDAIQKQLSKSMSLAREIVHGKASSLAEDVYRILVPNEKLIMEKQKADSPSRVGYRLEGVLRRLDSSITAIDLARLFMGSEGTLGIITQAKLKTLPLPKHRGSALFLFESIEKAFRAVASVSPYRPSMCEFLDKRRINLICEWDKRFVPYFSSDVEAAIVVEAEAETLEELEGRLNEFADEIRDVERLAFAPKFAYDENSWRLFRELINKSELALYLMQKNARALPLFGHVAIPVERLYEFVCNTRSFLQKEEINVSFCGHVGHGHLNVQPIVATEKKNIAALLEKVIPQFYDEVLSLNGTISSEGVCGIAQAPYIRQQQPELFGVFRQIKELFDPQEILNPGKVVSRDATDRPPIFRPFWHVKLPENSNDAANAEPNFLRQLELQIKWNAAPLFEPTYQCNGCGRCRSREESMRMCPLFRFKPDESETPRAKANLLRGILENDHDLELMIGEHAASIADSCLHCHICKIECPANIDIANLAFRGKSAYTLAHGMPLTEQFISNGPNLLRRFSNFGIPVNWILKHRVCRWILENILDIPQGRKLPTLTSVPYLKQIKRVNKRVASEKKVALMIDSYANQFDPMLAEAAVRVLEHNGVSVVCPQTQRASGAASFASGNYFLAEKCAKRNTAVFADYVRQGYDVIAIEPASVVCLTMEYPYILDDADCEIVSKNTNGIFQYLYRLHKEGQLRSDFEPIKAVAGYHAPCRSLVVSAGTLGTPTFAEEILRLIPELDVRRLERGCCGLGSVFGLKKKNYTMSLRLGMPLFAALRSTDIQFGTTECNLCKMQMEQGANKPTVHPIKLLAIAYGLMPELKSALSAVPKRYTVT